MRGGVEIDLVIACYNGVMLTSLGRKGRAWFEGEVALILIMTTQAAPEPQAGESFDSDCRRTVSFGFEHMRKMAPDKPATAHGDRS